MFKCSSAKAAVAGVSILVGGHFSSASAQDQNVAGASAPEDAKAPASTQQLLTFSRQIGGLGRTIELIDGFFKQHPELKTQKADWDEQRKPFSELVASAEQLSLKEGVTTGELAEHTARMQLTDRALMLYLKGLSPGLAAQAAPQPNQSPLANQPPLVGFYDAVGFEGFQTVLAGYLKFRETSGGAASPLDEKVLESLKRVRDARDPVQFLRESRTDAENIGEFLASALAKGKSGDQGLKDLQGWLRGALTGSRPQQTPAAADPAEVWHEKWKSNFPRGASPQHIVPKVNAFVQLASTEDGWQSITQGAASLKEFFSDPERSSKIWPEIRARLVPALEKIAATEKAPTDRETLEQVFKDMDEARNLYANPRLNPGYSAPR